MKTYQDWLKVADKGENERLSFIDTAIKDYKNSEDYRWAVDGDNYFNGLNTTIRRYEKILYNARGQAVKDYVSANHKIANRFFFRDVTQACSVLLGNGITWDKKANGAGPNALGADFDQRAIEALRLMQAHGKAYGFFNVDHVDIFGAKEFVPLVDEEDGMIKTGIRFWQLADNKPLRATLYELDGYTEYMRESVQWSTIAEKRAYIEIIQTSAADGEEVKEYMNYPSFPIVPVYANANRQSELVALRPIIDAIDLIQSGYANDIDDANIIYWTVTNCGGMDDADLVQMINKLKKLHATQTDDEAQIQSHVVEPSFQGREAILERLENQLYKDAMALNTYDLANGAVTATQIEAAYEPLNEKLDIYETALTEFINSLLALAGVEDQPTYTRSILINRTEEIQAVVNAALYLEPEYITEKIMTILGDKDQVEAVLQKQDEANLQRLTGGEA